MREYISIVEGRQPKAADPQSVYARTLVVARAIAHTLMIQRWNQEWTRALNTLVADARRRHEKNEADEIEYNSNYKARPFALDIEDLTNQWWQQTVVPAAEALEWAAKAAYERYQDDHPKVEQSDRMSLHQDELRMIETIRYRGNDSLDGLTVILDAINNFAPTDHLLDISYLDVVTRETQDFIERIIPAILAICRLHGAKSAT